MKINIRTNGLNANEITKINQACQIMEKALNSKEFKSFCLNFSWEKEIVTRRWFRKYTHIEKINQFHYTNLSNFQVYKKIMDGEEYLGGEGPDQEADIFFEIDRRISRNVIGYTYQNTRWQWMYLNQFRNYTSRDIASNLTHEWCHKLSFDHEYGWTSSREYSVPYAVGYFVQKFQY